jgi:hypothetical protein
MVNVISDETTRRLTAALLSVVTVPGAVIISAQDTRRVGSASGSINWIFHIVDTGTNA